jgi:FkbM family methyltransferase
MKYYEWPAHVAQGIIMDLVGVIAPQSSAEAVAAAVDALDGFLSMSPEGEASANCRLALQTAAIDALLYQIAVSINQSSSSSASALSAITYLIECGGAMQFVAAGGVEVISAVMKFGSVSERSRAANVMSTAVQNIASTPSGASDRDVLFAKLYVRRTALRFVLAEAALRIYHHQQSGTSSQDEDELVELLLLKCEAFADYWKQLTLIMSAIRSPSRRIQKAHLAQRLAHLRIMQTRTPARLAWWHSAAADILVELFGSETAASAIFVESVPAEQRHQFNSVPDVGQTGEYDPAGRFENVGSSPDHRDALCHPPCAGLAAQLLQCWIFKASRKLPQEECDDSSLLSCHHFNGQKNAGKYPGVELPDFSTSVVTRHGVMHHHLLDIYFTASLAVYGEWSFLESQLMFQHVPVGGTFLDVGAHVGTISLAMAQHVGLTGRVIAVEAQKNFCDMIERAAAANSMTQISVVHAAVDIRSSMCVSAMESSSLAIATNFGGFEIVRCNPFQKRQLLSKNQRSGGALPLSYSAVGTLHTAMSTVTIDAIMEAHGAASLHAIKLDCEGSELRALQGALLSLKRFRPAIFFEDNSIEWEKTTWASTRYLPASQQMKILHDEFLRPLGYACTQHQVPVFNPRNFRGQTANIFGDQASVVIFCKAFAEGRSEL